MSTFATTDKEIRDAIKTTIQGVAPLAVVFPWWALGYEPEQWPGILRGAALDKDDAGKSRVHGWVIRLRSLPPGETITANHVRREVSYSLMGLHYYETGTETSNSEYLFTTELWAIVNAFDAVRSLPSVLARCEPPSFQLSLPKFGTEVLHYALGALTVRPC